MRLDRELLDDADQLTTAPGTTPTSLFGDIPGPIWTAYLAAWALLFGLFIVFFSTDGRATLSVLTASFFALMTLGLPAALSMQSKGEVRRPPQRMIETWSGSLPVGAAAVQILLIPVGALMGLIAFIVLGM